MRYGSQDGLVMAVHPDSTVDLVMVAIALDDEGERPITFIERGVDLSRPPLHDQAGPRIIDRRASHPAPAPEEAPEVAAPEALAPSPDEAAPPVEPPEPEEALVGEGVAADESIPVTSRGYSADEAKRALANMTDEEQIHQFVQDDQRVTVQRAATERIRALRA
jgi:hypothetical protein